MLNPLGVPSRMNVGQILETHLGWATAGIGKKIDKALQQFNENGQKADLEAELKSIYGDEVYKDDIEPLNDDELKELAGNLKKGVPMATPVFDGAREPDIVKVLESAGLDSSGQVQLI